MDPLSLAASVAGLLSLAGSISKIGYEYISSVRQAPRELELALREVSIFSTLLHALHRQLVCGGIPEGALQDMVKSGALQNAKVLLQAVRDDLKEFEQLHRSESWKLGKRLKWPKTEAEVKKTLDEFQRLRETLTCAISVDILVTVRQVKTATDEIREGLLVISSELSTFPSVVKAHLANWTGVLVDQIQSHLFLCFGILVILIAFFWGRYELFASKQAVASAGLTAHAVEQAELASKTELMEWLGLRDVSPQNALSQALKIRHKGTGDWFLREPLFQNWVTSDNSVLWVRGALGSEKTVLTATVLDYLQLRKDKLNDAAAYTYFYISYQESEDRGFRSFLRSTTRQLLTQCGKPCINESSGLRLRRQSKLDGDSSPTNQDYIDFLKSFSLHFERVWMVVDGLDESSEINTFVNGLANLTTPSESRSGTRFQVLMTSRNEVKMKPLQSVATLMFTMSSNHIESDIVKYITDEVRDRVEAKKLPPEMRQDIIDALVRSSNGMFLLASLQLQHIFQLLSRADIRAALKTLPSNLYREYDRILSNAVEPQLYLSDQLKQILQWLSVGNGITLQQLAEAISVQPGDDWFSQDRVAYNPIALVERLGGLATVYESEPTANDPKGSPPPSQHGSFVRFAHYSVREYLGSEYLRRHKSLSGLYFNTSMAHLNAALTCLRHFSLRNFQNQCMSGESRDERRWRMLDGRFVVPHEFYTVYAIPNWQYHLVESKVDNKEALETLVLPHLKWFLDPSLKDQQYCVWEHLACPNIRSSDSSPNAEDCRWYYATRDNQDSILYLLTPGNKDKILSSQKERYTDSFVCWREKGPIVDQQETRTCGIEIPYGYGKRIPT